MDLKWEIWLGSNPETVTGCKANVPAFSKEDFPEDIPDANGNYVNLSLDTALKQIQRDSGQCTSYNSSGNMCLKSGCAKDNSVYFYQMRAFCDKNLLHYRSNPARCECRKDYAWSSQKDSCVEIVNYWHNDHNPKDDVCYGNPVMGLTGSKKQDQELGQWFGQTFSLQYDSMKRPADPGEDERFLGKTMASFGEMWVLGQQKSMKFMSVSGLPDRVVFKRGGDDWLTFAQAYVNGAYVWQSDSNSRYKLIDTTHLYDPDQGVIESYSQGSSYGVYYLTGERWDTGKVLRYYYSNSNTPKDIAPKSDLLIRIEDGYGHSVNFEYELPATTLQWPRVKRVIDPRGNPILVNYDAAGNMTKLTWSDGTTKQYLYEDPKHTWALTGMMDENGQRTGTYAYDNAGHAIETQGALGNNH